MALFAGNRAAQRQESLFRGGPSQTTTSCACGTQVASNLCHVGIETGYIKFLNSGQNPYYFGSAILGLDVPSVPARLQGIVAFQPDGSMSGAPFLNDFGGLTEDIDRPTFRSRLGLNGRSIEQVFELAIPTTPVPTP